MGHQMQQSSSKMVEHEEEIKESHGGPPKGPGIRIANLRADEENDEQFFKE
jgi:hypothetical protein